MTPANSNSQPKTVLIKGLLADNPIFRQVLGICSALAVTNLVLNTMVMSAALIWTTTMSCLTVSILRNYTPRNIRMMVQTLIIAFYVIIVDLILKAYWPQMSSNLGPYVGLIITNCIIIGRCEAFASSNTPAISAIDGFCMGIGYAVVLLIIASARELLGMGTFLGLQIPWFTANLDKWIIMVMPPGAFFMLAIVIWFFRTINPPAQEVRS